MQNSARTNRMDGENREQTSSADHTGSLFHRRKFHSLAALVALTCIATLRAADGAFGGDTLLNFQADLFTGRFSYSIPIAVAPARQGAEPKLGLGYNSSGGNGWCGVGWSLEVGSIERDTKFGVPVKWSGSSPLTEYDDSKGFIFSLGGVSGNLVNVGGNVYRQEIDGAFLKFEFNENNWVITDKSSNTFYFGQTSASRMENPRAGWTSGLAKSTYRWALDKVVDVNGNETTLSYVKHDNLLYLDEILYNGHTGGISKTHAVEFNLEDRSDVFFSYKSNFRVALKKRLTEVIVKIGGTRIRRYALQYSTSSSTTRSLLQSVTVYGPTDSDALPPTTFSYQVKPFEFEAQTDWTGLSSQGQSAYYWNSIHGSYKGDAFVTLADIDGDGLVDRVMRKAASPYTNFVAERNTGSNFLANDYRWYPLESQGQTSYTWNSIYVDDSENVAMIKFLDINGDSYPDRVMRNLSSPYTNFVVEFNSGVPGSGAFSADEIWGPIDAEGTGYWLSMHKQDSSNVPVDMADINGDGLPDRIMRKANSPYNLFKVQLNNGHGFNALVNWSPVSSQGQSGSSWNSIAAFTTEDGQKYNYVTLQDINGDSLPDRVMRTNAMPYTNFVVQFNNGAGFESELLWGPLDSQSLTQSYWNSPSATTYPNSDYGSLFSTLMDINGDGLPDRVMRKDVSPFTNFVVQINTGSGFAPAVSWSPLQSESSDSWANSISSWYYDDPVNDTYTTHFVDMMDMNGDGLVDRVMRKANSPFDRFKVQLNKGPIPDLLQEIRNGIGGIVQVAYKPSTQYDNRDRAWSTDPWSEGAKSLLPFAIYTVASITTSDGLGAANITTYKYRGGMWDSLRREFRGFQCVEVMDSLGSRRLTYFHQGGGRNDSNNGEFEDANSVAKKGLPYRVETVGNDGLLYNLTLNKIEEVMIHSNGWCFPYISQTIQVEYEGLTNNYRATATQLQYNTNTGNVVKSSNLGEITNVVSSTHSFTDIGSDAVYTHTTYASLGAILNKPSSILISSDSGGSTKLRETIFAYDARGNLTNNQVWVSNSVYITSKSIAYDGYGNPLRITDAAGITTTNTYDTTYQMFPVRQVTSGFTNETIYDARAANVLSSTDAKGLVISNIYDALFRLKETYISTNAFGAANLWRVKVDYVLKGVTNNYSTNFVRKRAFDGVDSVNGYDSYTYADGFGRTVQTRVEAENGQFRVSDVLYDERGNPNFGTLPYFSSGTNFTILSGSYLGTITDYDPIGRPVEVTPAVQVAFDSSGNLTGVTETGGDTGSPVGVTTTAFKDGSNPWATVVIDSENKTKKSYHDAFGRTIQIAELTSGGTFNTYYKYDLVGNLTNVTDHAGNITRIVYDNLGRKTSMTEPDMGTWSYAYDNAGRLTQQTDAKGQKLKFNYNDPLGRVKTQEVYHATGFVTNSIVYFYDTSDDGAFTVSKGQLFKVTDKEGWEKYGYDARGRAVKSRRHVNVMNTAYTIETTYDDADRISEILYPNSVAKIRYTYDTGGNLSSVVSIAGTGTNATSKEHFYRLGNVNALGQVTAYTNGNDSVPIVTTNTFYANSKRLKRMQVTQTIGGYCQDLTYTFDKVSNLKSVADAVYSSSASASLSNIEYDDLHRLTRVDNAAGTQRYAYNAIGNILTNFDMGTGEYTYGTKPHAVSTANGKSHYYDTNGNMIGRGSQTLSYDEQNRLALVENSAGPPPVYFGYAHDGTRLWRRKGSSDYTIWIGGIYESRGIKTLCHVMAGGKRIATFEPAGGGPYAFVPQAYDWAKTAERAIVWPLQDGRTPWTILLCLLLAFLGASVGSRVLDARARGERLRPPRFRPAPFWQQLISLLVIVSLIFTTTQTNVYAQVYDPVFYYYHADHLGSSNVITDRSGYVVQHYEYSSFGNERHKHNSSAFPVSNRYTDQILDEDTGLYFYNARYYDPELGRFCQPDTLVPKPGDPQTLNRYTYVNNNPLKYIDPTGHDFGLSAVIAAVVIGAVIGGASAAAQGGNIGLGILTGAVGGLLGGLGSWAGAVVGVATGAAAGFTVGTFVGGVVGSAAAGAANAAIMGTDIGIGALTGAVSGVIAFGVSQLSYQLIGNYVENFGELAIGASVRGTGGVLSGGINAELQGGDFWEGAKGGAWAVGIFAAFNLSDAWKGTFNRTPVTVLGDRAAYQDALAYHKDIAEMARHLETRGGYTITAGAGLPAGHDGDARTISWDPRSAASTTRGGTRSPAIRLAHEMRHAHRLPNLLYPSFVRNLPAGSYGRVEEWRVIVFWEIDFARRIGEGVRYDHYGTPFPVGTPTGR